MSPERKARAAEQAPAPTQTLLTMFDALHQSRFGVRAALQPKRDAKLVAELWRRHGTEETRRLMRAFFQLQDRWLLSRGFSLPMLVQFEPALVIQQPREAIDHNAWFQECKQLHGGSCNGSGGHRVKMLIEQARRDEDAKKAQGD